MLPTKRTWSEAQALGADSHQLPVLSWDSFGIVASFVGREDLGSMSCANHAAFDLLQENRVKRRAEWDDSLDDAEWDDATGRLRYYNCIESFTYQFLLGQLVLEFGESDKHFAEETLEILHHPILEHLLTLCGSNLQLARNVVANYTHFFKVTSHLQDVPDDGDCSWITARPQLRMDLSMQTRWEKWDETGLSSYFNDYFEKSDFPGLDAYAYVEYLIRESDEVFNMIQCTLTLRMRSACGKCELGACGTLLEDMHMTTTVDDFVTHLRTIHMATVQQHIADENVDDSDDESEIADALYWYDNIAPSGIYSYDKSQSYADLGYRHY